jgi:hypothetical protein
VVTALLFSYNVHLPLKALTSWFPDVEPRSYIPGIKWSSQDPLAQHSNCLLGFLQMHPHKGEPVLECLQCQGTQYLQGSRFQLGKLLFLESSFIYWTDIFLKLLSFTLDSASGAPISVSSFHSLPSFQGLREGCLWQVGEGSFLHPYIGGHLGHLCPRSLCCTPSPVSPRLCPKALWKTTPHYKYRQHSQEFLFELECVITDI